MKNILSGSILGLFGFAACLTLSACDGDSSGDTCKNAAACGGNIVGTWEITSSCVSVSASMFNEDCPTATVSGSDIKITGAVTYSADMTYMTNTTMSGSAAVTLPVECLTSNGVTVTCAQLNQVFAADPNSPPVNCVTAGTGCKCTITLENQASTEAGTYTTTAAGLLTETPTGESADESDYCVKGTGLTLSPHQGAGMMGQDNVSGTLTLTKR